MSIEEALEWIHSRLKFNIRPGLSRVSALLELLGQSLSHAQSLCRQV